MHALPILYLFADQCEPLLFQLHPRCMISVALQHLLQELLAIGVADALPISNDFVGIAGIAEADVIARILCGNFDLYPSAIATVTTNLDVPFFAGVA